MPEDKTAEMLFLLAITMEKEAYCFYQNLKKVFSHCPPASEFWAIMMGEEKQHIRELNLIHKSLPPEVLRRPADPEILKQARRVAKLSLFEKARSVETLNDAYLLAHDLENSEVITVFKFIRERYVPPVKREEFTLSQLDVHLERIMNFPASFGDFEERERVLSRKK